MIKKAFRILKATFGVVTNEKKLLDELYFGVYYESLLTDFHKVEEIEYSENLDFYIIMLDEPGTPFDITVEDRRIFLTGAVLKATEETSDLRYTIFGNEGLLFRYVLMFLEKHYDVYSFHACALYDEKTNQMYIGPGGAGSGKTCLILKGLELGLKLFSTEMTHFSVVEGLTLYKGSLVDNVRIGNLKYSYAGLTKKLKLKLPESADEWGKKIAIDLTKLETKFDSIKKVGITIILPHIEEGRDENIVTDVKNPRVARKALFDNISDKIANNVLLYETVPLMGFDETVLMKKRMSAVDKLLNHVSRVARVVGGSKNCWDGIIRK